ncbi:MAG: hypothetical protein P9L90_03425 [Candidatus Aadella gelida]|nr:hypothetical protein [Candidatus Aadella gelida]
MSWTCPHQDNDFCELRKKECKPGAEGCVLAGRVKFGKDEDKPETKKKGKCDE